MSPRAYAIQTRQSLYSVLKQLKAGTLPSITQIQEGKEVLFVDTQAIIKAASKSSEVSKEGTAEIAMLRDEVAQLRQEVAQLKEKIQKKAEG